MNYLTDKLIELAQGVERFAYRNKHILIAFFVIAMITCGESIIEFFLS